MKRWPYLLILAVLIAGVAASSIRNIPRIAEARMPMVVMSGSTAAGGEAGCDTAYIENTGASVLTLDIEDAEASTYSGWVYNYGTEKTLCAVSFNLSAKDAGCTANTYHIEVWTLSGTDFDTQHGTDSDGVVGDSGWDETDVLFSFSSPITMSASTDYAVVITHNNSPSSATEAKLHGHSVVENGNTGVWDSSGARQLYYPSAMATATFYE
jgi:hypothetical protein